MNRTPLALAAAALLGALPALAAEAEAPTLEEVLSGHYRAIGGVDAWRAVATVRMRGTMRFPHERVEAPFVMTFKPPDKARLEFTLQGETAIQAVSDGVAWQVMPFLGKPRPQRMAGDQARLMIERADFDGPLVGWREDGHRIEYLGRDQVEGAWAHELEVDLATGGVRTFFLDAETFLPIMSSARRTMGDQEVQVETLYGDYREVDGLTLAHSIEVRQAGASTGQLTLVETAELDVELADGLFQMPGL